MPNALTDYKQRDWGEPMYNADGSMQMLDIDQNMQNPWSAMSAQAASQFNASNTAATRGIPLAMDSLQKQQQELSTLNASSSYPTFSNPYNVGTGNAFNSAQASQASPSQGGQPVSPWALIGDANAR